MNLGKLVGASPVRGALSQQEGVDEQIPGPIITGIHIVGVHMAKDARGSQSKITAMFLIRDWGNEGNGCVIRVSL